VLLVAQPGGQWWTLAFLLLVITADTGAYASGLSFGKHPMAPTISPKKTWEGFAGAALVCMVAGVLLSLFMLGQPWWFGLIFGSVISLTATFGDLAESLIKRDLGSGHDSGCRGTAASTVSAHFPRALRSLSSSRSSFSAGSNGEENDREHLLGPTRRRSATASSRLGPSRGGPHRVRRE
jgi:hypothetical protein